MFDKVVLNSFLVNIRKIIHVNRLLIRYPNDESFVSIQLNYRRKDNLFSNLCQKYGTDKGQTASQFHSHKLQRAVHTYSDFYELMFLHMRMEVLNVFECGIGSNSDIFPSSMGKLGTPGASLRVLKDYFPSAQIVGADIDEMCLFEEDRIKTYALDQCNVASINNFWGNFVDTKFELMIDDGLHTFEAGSTLFENSISHLAKDGFYIIEDVLRSDLDKYEKFFMDLNYLVFYVHITRNGMSVADNNLILVRKIWN